MLRIPNGLTSDRRGLTRLEFGLLSAMLGAMVVNGIATLGGGLSGTSRPMGSVEARREQQTAVEPVRAIPPAQRADQPPGRPM